MALEFRDVNAAPLVGFRAMAPAGVIIGVIGDKGSGVAELLKLAGGLLQATDGEVIGESERRYVALGEPLNLAPASVISLDQALATQDALVRARTLTGLDRLRRNGSTILLSSHEYGLLETLCDEVWWLHEGQLAAKGDPKETLQKYRRHVAEAIRGWGDTISPRIAPSFRHGNGHAEVIGLESRGAGGPTIVWKSGEMATVKATVRFHEAVAEPVLGLMIRTQIGFEVYGTNTDLEHVKIGPCQAGETVDVTFAFLCDLCPGAYTLTVASHDPDGTAHDWLDDAIAITVTDERYTAGVANLHAKVTAEKQAATAEALK